jgi:Domain of unknown function (DUF4158)
VPVEFLSDEQVAGYGRFTEEPSRLDLERCCWLSDTDRVAVGDHRGDHNRLGFAVQLATVRLLGRFLADPVEVPWSLVEFLAEQLDIGDASVVKSYGRRLPTQHEHAREIAERYGYQDFGDPIVGQLEEFVASRAWLTTDGPTMLFARAVGWLRDRKVLLPGVTVLARLVARVRSEQADRLHAAVIDAAGGAGVGERLERLLVAGDDRVPELERLRVGPRQASPQEIVRQVRRLQRVRDLGGDAIDLSVLPAARVATLARYGLQAKSRAFADLSVRRRHATLIATLVSLHADVADELGDTIDGMLAGRVIRHAERDTTAARVRALRDRHIPWEAAPTRCNPRASVRPVDAARSTS